MATGFYAPGSISGSYVQAKRADSALAYDAAETDIGISEQAALQDLSSKYATTIESAYSSYLSNQRGIAASSMGQGYKAEYEKMAQQDLSANLSEASTNLAAMRSEIGQNAEAAKAQVHQAFAAEVANLDRIATSFSNYRDYVAQLSDAEGKGPLTEEQLGLGIDEMYQTLSSDEFGQTLRQYKDENEATGKTFQEWLNTQVDMTNATDKAWYEWYLTGGYQDFVKSIEGRKGETALAKRQAAEAKAQEETKLADLKAKVDKAQKEYDEFSSSITGGMSNAGGIWIAGKRTYTTAQFTQKQNKLREILEDAKRNYDRYASTLNK